ncbi:hypothetical protein COOONC_11908 [Cooperia oncophora]
MLRQKALEEVLGQVNTAEIANLLIPGGREDLKEAMIVCEDGIVAATRVSNMLLALKLAVGRARERRGLR